MVIDHTAIALDDTETSRQFYQDLSPGTYDGNDENGNKR